MNFWKPAVWAVLFLVVYEGALRKWVAPGYQGQIYLAKDGILGLAYVGFFLSQKRPWPYRGAMNGLRNLAIASFVYYCVELLNPASPSLLLSIVGLKNYIFYVPLAFMVPYLFESEEDLRRKLRIYSVFVMPAVILGLVQFQLNPAHWLNGYVGQDDSGLSSAVGFGAGNQRARAASTFSYIGGYVSFLTMTAYLGLAGLMSRQWRLQGDMVATSLLAGSVMAMFTTGSRTPIYGLVITAPLVLWSASRAGLVSSTSVIRLGAAGFALLFLVNYIVPEAIEAYQYRTEHADSPIDRLLSPLDQFLEAFDVAPPLGTGMASTHGSAMAIMGTRGYWWLEGHFFELETARVMQETGIIGFMLTFAMRLFLFIQAVVYAGYFRIPLFAGLAAVIAGYFVQHIPLAVVNDPTAGIYYWFSAGLLYAMYKIEREERGRAVVQTENIPARNACTGAGDTRLLPVSRALKPRPIA